MVDHKPRGPSLFGFKNAYIFGLESPVSFHGPSIKLVCQANSDILVCSTSLCVRHELGLTLSVLSINIIL